MKHLIIAIRLTTVTLVFFGVIYPSTICGIAHLTAHDHGGGDMTLIAQPFVSDKYFNTRPSGPTNSGPADPEYLAKVEERIQTVLQRNPTVDRKDIPVDLVTVSGSGLDPHISVKAARIQVDRIARTRGLMNESVNEVIDANIERPMNIVNVLKINLALDQIKK